MMIMEKETYLKIACFLLLEWGIIVGITSNFGWWNLLIHPFALLSGWYLGRLHYWIMHR